jgi:hypothetical protein
VWESRATNTVGCACVFISDGSGATATGCSKPRLEIAHTDRVLNFWLFDQDRDGGLAVPDGAHPVAAPESRRATCDRFVEALGADLDGVLTLSMSRQVTLHVRSAMR